MVFEILFFLLAVEEQWERSNGIRVVEQLYEKLVSKKVLSVLNNCKKTTKSFEQLYEKLVSKKSKSFEELVSKKVLSLLNNCKKN